MRKILVLLSAVLLLMPAVFGQGYWMGPGGGSTVTENLPEFVNWHAVYPTRICEIYGIPELGDPWTCEYDYPERNDIYPEFEFAYDGDTIHFVLTVTDEDSGGDDVLYGDARVKLDCDDTLLSNPDYPMLTLSSGPTSQDGTWYGTFTGDYIVPDAGFLSDRCTFIPQFKDGGSGMWHSFTIEGMPLYENEDELLANPEITGTIQEEAYTWTLVPNSETSMDPYPMHYGFVVSEEDNEGQGILGDVYTIVSPFECTQSGGSGNIYSEQVKYKTGDMGAFLSFSNDPDEWALLYAEEELDLLGFSGELYYKVYYSGLNNCNTWNGGRPLVAFVSR